MTSAEAGAKAGLSGHAAKWLEKDAHACIYKTIRYVFLYAIGFAGRAVGQLRFGDQHAGPEGDGGARPAAEGAAAVQEPPRAP